MRKLLLFLIFLVLIFGFEGCKKSSTGPGEEDNEEIKLSENTIILADSTVNKINQALGDSVIYFSKDAQEVLQLKEGNVIVSAVEEGFLRKVKETKEEGSYIVVRTEYAALEDAIEKGNLVISNKTLNFDGMRTKSKLRGVRFKSRGDLLEVDFNALIYEDPTSGAQIRGVGKSVFGAVIDTMGAEFSFGLQSLKLGLKVYHSESLGVEITKGCSFEGEIKLASFALPPILVYVGIPIVITPHVDLYIGANLNVQASVSTSVQKEDTIIGGITYSKTQGWSTFSDYKKSFSYSPPSVSLSGEAKVYAIVPEISLQIYELIGPYAQMEGYGRIEVNPQATPWWVLYGGFDVEGGVKMEILAWDVTWSGSIYSKEWELANASGGTNTPPSTPSALSGPSTGDVGISYSFSTSTTDPDGDNVAYQFDWGDGDISSWSSYVASGSSVSMSHSWSSTGTYSVKAKAKDVSGAESGWSRRYSIEITVSGANTWTQKADFGGVARDNAVGFSIGDKGYIGTGHGTGSVTKDFWEYDPQTNAWTQKADFGGVARWYTVGFSIGNRGYIGTGSDESNSTLGDFWEYDPSINSWIQKAGFGGGARSSAVGFSIGNRGYIGTGGSFKRDFWEYDPQTNTWTQKADFGGIARASATGFATQGKGYIGLGYRYYPEMGNVYFSDFWEYDPASNVWTQITPYPGLGRMNVVGFSIGERGYIGTGYYKGASEFFQETSDFWEYDPATNTWIQKADFGGGVRACAVGFSVGNRGYLGTGVNPSYMRDFWEYDPGQ